MHSKCLFGLQRLAEVKIRREKEAQNVANRGIIENPRRSMTLETLTSNSQTEPGAVKSRDLPRLEMQE